MGGKCTLVGGILGPSRIAVQRLFYRSFTAACARVLAIHRSSRRSTGSAHLNCLIAGVSLNMQDTSAGRTIPGVVPTPQSPVRSIRFGLKTVPGESVIAMVVDIPTSLNRLSWNTSRGSPPRHGSQSRWYSPRKYCTETRVRNASTRTPTRRCPRPNKIELAFAISWALKFRRDVSVASPRMRDSEYWLGESYESGETEKHWD